MQLGYYKYDTLLSSVMPIIFCFLGVSTINLSNTEGMKTLRIFHATISLSAFIKQYLLRHQLPMLTDA